MCEFHVLLFLNFMGSFYNFNLLIYFMFLKLVL